MRDPLASIAAALACVFAAGCSPSAPLPRPKSAGPPVAVRPVAATAEAPSAEPEALPATSPASAPAEMNPAAEHDGAQAEPPGPPAAPAYTPPFPQRTDPFRQPSITQLTTPPATGDGDSDDQVQLKGFVNVDGMRALISINGLVTAMKEGEQHGDLTVVEISPPNVMLQRGRTRWQQGLYKAQ